MGGMLSDFEPFESEDTMSILNRYIEESDINLDKSIVQKCYKRFIEKHVS